MFKHTPFFSVITYYHQIKMKLSLSIIAFFAFAFTANAQIPAFPGAEGHGRNVSGGRKGTVYHVTNLSDNENEEGSLRWALKKGGTTRKTIVFDVGGVIALTSDLKIPSNTTIAGQTAPYPGITLRYYSVNPNGNEIIMRFIRIRRGEEKDVNDGADASTARHFTNIILDHCSFSWSIDEVASFYDNNNFTMQWCTLGESLNNAGHNKGAHGYGGIWGGKLASFHHNLICHVNNRSPRFNGARYNWTGYTTNKLYQTYKWENAVQAENVDFRNCVIYNANGCYGGPGGGQINMVGNYYKSGPAATIDRITTVSVGAEDNAEGYPIYWGMTSRYYVEGNMVEGNTTISNDNFGKGFKYDSGIYTINGAKCSLDENNYYGEAVEHLNNTSGKSCVKIQMSEPTAFGTVTTHKATKAYEKVLAYGGASLYRDTVDARYMRETRTGTATYKGSVTGKGGRIDKVSDVKGYTEANFPTGSRPEGFDTDGDGMPDDWETANGLDSHNANDGKTYTLDAEKKWYTNLEVYLNSLVEEIMKAENADAEESVDEYYPEYKQTTISNPQAASPVLSSAFHNLKGQRIQLPHHGLYIRTDYMADGTKRIHKIIR